MISESNNSHGPSDRAVEATLERVGICEEDKPAARELLAAYRPVIVGEIVEALRGESEPEDPYDGYTRAADFVKGLGDE